MGQAQGVFTPLREIPQVYDGASQSTVDMEKGVSTAKVRDFQLTVMDVLGSILVELAVISELLNEGLNCREDLDTLRDDVENDLFGGV